MSGLEHRQPTAAPATDRSPENRLDSWKAIASYLGRGVRTVQRWEREEGLPVHRLAHEKRGSVYADKPELDAWWESRRRTLSASQASSHTIEPAATSAPAPERVTWMSAATFWPTLSSDGRLLAYVSDGGRVGGSPQIWLHQIGGSAACLTRGSSERSHLSFSADDTRIVFTASDDAGQNVYAMPTLGGEPKLLERGARAGRPSPDGRWLAYIAVEHPTGVRIRAMEGTSDRTIAPGLIDVAFAIWSPDSRHVLVHAHEDASTEPDYWVVAIDGSAVVNTGVVQRLRKHGAWPLTQPAAWADEAIVFSAITPTGVAVWRQPLDPVTLQPSADPVRLTRGTEFDWFATAAAGRVAFVSTRSDQNLWAIDLDPATGMSRGALRRLTRGPGFVGYLSVSRDGNTLAYFFARPNVIGMMLRDLASGAESELAPEPRLEYGYLAMSPSGEYVACGARLPGPRVMRPIFVVSVADGACRKLGDDFGARPRQWVDDRHVVVERFGGRLHSVGLLDTASAAVHDLLASTDRSITNPRVSADGGWLAFDAARPGGPPTVFVTRMRTHEIIAEDDWIVVDRSASHPFWSADGVFLYYLPTTPSREFRNVVRARRFDGAHDRVTLGDGFTAFSSAEMVIPALSSAIAPVATHDQIIFVLGDFRGDVWMLDVSTMP